MRWLPLLLLIGAIPASRGHAQPSAVETLEIDACPARAALSEAELAPTAGERFTRGAVLYAQGDYRAAIGEFVGAYCTLPKATVLKDIAQANERLLDFERTIAYLQRFLVELPDDNANAVVRQEIGSRIAVLAALPAQIKVATSPPAATVTLTGAEGLTARGVTGRDQLEARAGTYTLRVELDGYEPIEQAFAPRIGKPYSFFFELKPRQGRLKIRVDPADARVFVDQRLVALGAHELDVDRGAHTITIEANGRLPQTQTVDVAAGETETVRIVAPLKPTSGRTQLVVVSGIAGAALGGSSLAAAGDGSGLVAVGGVAGVVLGGVGAYYGVPDDIPAGQSSFIITSGVIGAVTTVSAVRLFSDDEDVAAGALSIGLIGGATFGALTTDIFDLSVGDAALLNSGALWGSTAGALFGSTFETSPELSAGLVLTGLAAGTAAGALLGRGVEFSRGHVALIDVAGIAGIATAAAIQSALDSGEASTERQAHFALGGATAGIVAGVYFTRNMDVVKLSRIRPNVTSVRDVTGRARVGLGVMGDF